jgi:hypothetical protein
MAQVLEDADREGVPLILAVDPDYQANPDMDIDRLRAWYERLGFRRIISNEPDFLLRNPKVYEGTGWPQKLESKRAYCTNPAHGYGEHDRMCVPPADPTNPNIRMIRVLWGLCGYCNDTDDHTHSLADFARWHHQRMRVGYSERNKWANPDEDGSIVIHGDMEIMLLSDGYRKERKDGRREGA